MAQGTESRIVIRRNIRLAGGKHLIFDWEDGFWRVVFYRPARSDSERWRNRELQEKMEKAAMLPKMKVGFWARFGAKNAELATAISSVLISGDYGYLTREILDYIRGTEWNWYLNA